MKMHFYTLLLFSILTVFSYGSFADEALQKDEGEKEQKTYLEPTVENLSKLYIKLEAIDLEDDRAIDNYLRINECEIFKTYINDDFEWPVIRESAREHLKSSYDSFPRRFEFRRNFRIGRYDLETQSFPILPADQIKRTRKIEIIYNEVSSNICGTTQPLKFYPKNIMLILNRPVNISKINLPEEVAKEYLKEVKRETVVDSRRRSRDDGVIRTLYLRLRVNAVDFQGITISKEGGELANIFAVLEGVDIYKDPGFKEYLTTIHVE